VGRDYTGSVGAWPIVRFSDKYNGVDVVNFPRLNFRFGWFDCLRDNLKLHVKSEGLSPVKFFHFRLPS
jgi:hypothetical protein